MASGKVSGICLPVTAVSGLNLQWLKCWYFATKSQMLLKSNFHISRNSVNYDRRGSMDKELVMNICALIALGTILILGWVWFASTVWLYQIACSGSEKCKLLKKKSCTHALFIRQHLALDLK